MSVGSFGNPRAIDSETNASLQILNLLKEVPSILFESYRKEHDSLQQLADETEDYSDHTAYQNVATQLSTVKQQVFEDFESRFTRSLTSDIKKQILEENQALNFHTDHLSIVTDKELKYQLKLEAGFSHSRDEFEKCLVQSQWKFHKAASKSEINSKLDSIRPGFLSATLQSALNTFISDKTIARIAYRFIGGNFFNSISDLYASIQPALADFVRTLKANEQEHVTTEHVTTEANENPFTSSALPTPEVKELNNPVYTPSNIDVSELIQDREIPARLDNTKYADLESISDIDFGDITPDTRFRNAEIEDVVNLLDALSQKALVNTDQALDVNDIRSALKTSLSNLSEEGILTVVDKVSENVLNLVSHLFESLNNEDTLIEEVLAQISRIQTPVMQVALKDSALFKNTDHPVREYLNALGSLGIRISDPKEEGYFKIRDSITVTLKEFKGNVEYFDNATQHLKDYIDDSIYSIKHQSDQFNADGTLKPTLQIPIKEFLESQTALLARELDFHKLLKIVWGAILAKVIRRHGIHSDEWNNATEIYSLVMWSTQVEASKNGKSEILGQIPELVKSIQAIFDHYKLNDDIRSPLLDQMFGIHLQIMKGINGKDIEDSAKGSFDIYNCLKGKILGDTDSEYNAEFDTVELDTSEPINDPLESVFTRFDAISPFEAVSEGHTSPSDATNKGLANKQELQHTFDKLKSLPLESIIVVKKDGGSTRYQLKNKSVALGKFALKPFDSNEIVVKTRDELAVEFLRNNATVVNDANIFDTALDCVVSKIHSTSA